MHFIFLAIQEEIYYSSGGKGRGFGTATGASAVSDNKHLQLMTRAHFCEGLAKAATYSQPQGTTVGIILYTVHYFVRVVSLCITITSFSPQRLWKHC